MSFSTTSSFPLGTMAEFVEQLADELNVSDRRKAFSTLTPVFNGICEQPADSQRRRIPGDAIRSLPGACRQFLQSCGFAENGDGSFLLPPNANLEHLQAAATLMECLSMSLEEEDDSAKRPRSESANNGVAPMDFDGIDDPELREALKMSMESGDAKPSEAADADLAARLEKEEEERIDVDFERFNAEEVLISNEAVEKINEFCKASGEQYVDPQFPPTDKSLYIDVEDASSWKCPSCSFRNPMGPVPDMPKSKEEAEQMQKKLDAIICSKCGGKPGNVALSQIMSRPCQWIRPGTRCTGCEMIYFSMPNAAEFVTRMCTHYLRDHITQTTVGSPWKLIREAARPEDVNQGALGNCWFAGALSVIAQMPELIDNLFITKDYNPNGAYQIQLFLGGEWKGVLIDDLMPTAKIFQGYMDGQMVYYSHGGTLSYLSCARHQLWVPLIEKAAAKLFGCYGALSGGTFAEALHLFSGFPVERVELYVPSELRKRRAERRDQKLALRTQMLLEGKEPDYDDDSDLEQDDNGDLLWTRLLSFQEAGYIMGMACTAEGCEKTKTYLSDQMGLQAPHAYGVLDVREVMVEGRIERLMQIRNPWGERAPKTWMGDWGKDSKKWTFELKKELGVVNKSNVPMYDQMSIFWMSFKDVKEHFAALDVCRVHKGWLDQQHCRCWLPCGVGPGTALELTVYYKCQVDIAIWQEKHITRESALGGRSTNVDIGFSVLRAKGQNPDGSTEYECVSHVKRTRHDLASAEMILEGGYTYKIVPLCFNQMQKYAPRRAVLTVHSEKPTKLEQAPSHTWRDVAVAVTEACRKFGKSASKDAIPGIKTFMLQDGDGFSHAVENNTDQPFGIQIDCSDSVGCVSSKQGNDMFTVDVIPARSRKVSMMVTFAQGASRCGYSFGSSVLPAEALGFALASEDVHIALPITELSASKAIPPPDDEILKAAPPLPPPKTKSTQSLGDDEDDLAAALAMSMQGVGGTGAASPTADEDEALLQQAIAMSMAPQPATQAPAAAAAPPAAAPPAEDPKIKMQALVKQLFTQYREQGMAPNDAAARAMQDAKTKLGM
eukprot:TRINITY_DN31073_c0_g1_i1.p1 TRINITY_DN31073_c0_g1~~TRINITY_DN31073_c0_g1_i1.p1  ORF type:complete len:1064 (-),score=234.28 TRINITY_DN31073_c0_g1_i1:108-3299(-)